MHARLISDMRFCRHCGRPILGPQQHVICRDGHREGPKVELCDHCGGPSVTCRQIWSRISRHAKCAPDRRLN
jgi:hypothetical protein